MEIESTSDSFTSQKVDLEHFRKLMDIKEAMLYKNEIASKCWKLTFTDSTIQKPKKDFFQCLFYGYFTALIHSNNAAKNIEHL